MRLPPSELTVLIAHVPKSIKNPTAHTVKRRYIIATNCARAKNFTVAPRIPTKAVQDRFQLSAK